MRGGYLHNRVLLEPIAHKASQLGFHVDCEVPIVFGERVLFGDLVIRDHSRLVLVEAELTPRRVANDLVKASALDASDLWLLVPTPNVAQSVQRALTRFSLTSNTRELFVLSLPQALQRLKEFSELFSASNVETENKKKFSLALDGG